MGNGQGKIAIDCVGSGEAFFRDCIRESAFKQQQVIDESVEFYLVSLLASYMRFDNSDHAEDILNKPLALMLNEALEATPADQLTLFKKLGDKALYLSGFFKEYFNNKVFSKEYYIEMGKGAYQNLSTIFIKLGDDDFHGLYLNLSDGFETSVIILEDVSSNLKGFSNQYDHLEIKCEKVETEEPVILDDEYFNKKAS